MKKPNPQRKIISRRGAVVPKPRPLQVPIHRPSKYKRVHPRPPIKRKIPILPSRQVPQQRPIQQRPQFKVQRPQQQQNKTIKFPWLVVDGKKLDSELFQPVATQGHTSTVWTNSAKTLIVKKVIRFLDYSVFEREIYWLRILNEQQVSWAPKLIQVSKPFIVMENVGTNITKQSLPSNWNEQVKAIEHDFQTLNLRHNDIKGNELLVKSGKLYLIDFQWASLGNDWSCKGLFSARSKPHGLFNSLQTVIKSVLK
jgi:predicted Ser/Thr protein kinase